MEAFAHDGAVETANNQPRRQQLSTRASLRRYRHQLARRLSKRHSSTSREDSIAGAIAIAIAAVAVAAAAGAAAADGEGSS